MKAGHSTFTIFEMNQIALKSDGLNSEKVPELGNNLALVTLDKSATSTTYYQLKNTLTLLAGSLNISFVFKPHTAETNVDTYHEPKRSADIYIGDVHIGIIGEIKRSVAKNMKLPETTSCAELDLELLLTHQKSTTSITPQSKYQAVTRDITLQVSADTIYQKVTDALTSSLNSKSGLTYRLSPLAIYQRPGDKTKNISFRITLTPLEKTLTSEAVSGIIKSISKELSKKVGAVII
jgi:phenylalanyl-tRNA synthetase beta chain